MKAVALLALLAVAPASCNPNNVPAADRATICEALIGPLRYNTANKASQRYAAVLLAMDLKQRNQVWTALGCREGT
jgi:hypothetical protein